MRKIVAALLAVLLAACSSVDCPVENTVALVCELRKAGGTADTLSIDTLTITTTRRDGNDTTLINRLTKASSFTLPISSGAEADTFHVTLSDTLGNSRTATLRVAKTDEPHFESVDCAMSHFHTLTATSVEGSGIDSVTIHKTNVDYDASTSHLYFYLTPSR